MPGILCVMQINNIQPPMELDLSEWVKLRSYNVIVFWDWDLHDFAIAFIARHQKNVYI